jgi:hypothetical protein
LSLGKPGGAAAALAEWDLIKASPGKFAMSSFSDWDRVGFSSSHGGTTLPECLLIIDIRKFIGVPLCVLARPPGYV